MGRQFEAGLACCRLKPTAVTDRRYSNEFEIGSVLIFVDSMTRRLFENLSLCNGAALKHRAGAWFSYLRNRRELSRAINAAHAKDPGRRVICISKTQHMGDVVTCEPVARQVRQENPSAFIVWCIQKEYADLMRYHPAVDYVLPVKCMTEWILFSDSTLFDQIMDLEMDRKPCKTCRLELKKTESFGITFDNYLRVGSLLEVYLQCANYQVEDKTPRLFIPKEVKEKVENLVEAGTRFVAVHCASNEDCRDWKVGKWDELLRWLVKDRDVQIVEVGTKPVLSQLGLPRYRSLCGQLSILETAEVIRRSALFVGVESGPAHLANATGARGVILIGKYASFDRYQPYNGNFASPDYATLVYSNGAAAAIEVETVQKAIDAKLSQVLTGLGAAAAVN